MEIGNRDIHALGRRLGELAWWCIVFACLWTINAIGVELYCVIACPVITITICYPTNCGEEHSYRDYPKLQSTRFHIEKIACNVKSTNWIFMHEFLKASCHTQIVSLQSEPAWRPCQWWKLHGRGNNEHHEVQTFPGSSLAELKFARVDFQFYHHP